ncbi:14250_t:CDS:2, partial [Dentiscutata heterogama]
TSTKLTWCIELDYNEEDACNSAKSKNICINTKDKSTCNNAEDEGTYDNAKDKDTCDNIKDKDIYNIAKDRFFFVKYLYTNNEYVDSLVGNTIALL